MRVTLFYLQPLEDKIDENGLETLLKNMTEQNETPNYHIFEYILCFYRSTE